MASSPIRLNLLNIESTPAKIVVSCDINSWQQTHLKQSACKNAKPKAFQRRKYTINKQNQQNQYTNLASLKKRKAHLINSNAKPTLNQELQTTRPQTQLNTISGSSSQKRTQTRCTSIKEFSIKLTEIKVSEFKEDSNSTHNLILYRNKKELPPFLTKVISNNINKTSKKSTSQYLQSIENKILNPNVINRIRKRGSNLLRKSPEDGNLAFKTRRILSVRQAEPTI